MTTTTDVMQLFDYTLNGISSAEGVLSTHSHDLAAALRSAVDTLVAERDALMEFAQYEAQCPCCSEIIKCVRGCTFHNDCPNEADRMDAARAALKGKT